MKIFKRLRLFLAGLLLTVILAVAVGYGLLRSRPAFYRPYTWEGEQRGVTNQQAMDNLARVHNLASESQARERRAQRGSPNTGPVTAPLTVSLTEEQINALLLHNAEVEGLDREYQRYVGNPVVLLRDGQIILAGRVQDFGGIIASVQFQPELDQHGRLHIRLTRTMGGRLPLPKTLVTTQLERFRSALAPQLPRWRREAAMDSTGLTNSSAVSAAMADWLKDLLSDTPAEPVVFVPVQGGKSVPLRLTGLRLAGQSVTFTVESMNPAQRETLLKHIRAGPVGQPKSER